MNCVNFKFQNFMYTFGYNYYYTLVYIMKRQQHIREDDFCCYIWLTDKMRRIFVDFQMRCLISKSLWFNLCSMLYGTCCMVDVYLNSSTFHLEQYFTTSHHTALQNNSLLKFILNIYLELTEMCVYWDERRKASFNNFSSESHSPYFLVWTIFKTLVLPLFVFKVSNSWR